MTLTATVADPLTDPVPRAWDAAVAAWRLSPLWTSAVVTAADWCAPARSSLVVVGDAGGAPVALFHARHHGGPQLRYAGPGRPPWTAVTECRLVPGMLEAGLAFAPSSGAAERAEAVRVFERAVRGPAIAYRELAGHHLAAVPAARRRRLLLSPAMVLDNAWPDLGAYLATLSPKWRARLRKIHDGLRADPGTTVALGDTIDAAEAAWLAELARRRHATRLVRRPPLPAVYFERLAALAGSRFLTYRGGDGRLRAFTAAVDTGEELLLVNWGSRGAADLYLDQYRHWIELMITTGRRRMVLGKGLEQLKARYGARPEPRWGLLGLR
jgi:hypothetical protein